MTLTNLVVVGAGGFGREALDVAVAMNAQEPRWNVLGVIDDAPSDLALQRLNERGVAYLGSLEDLLALDPVAYVIGIGSTAVRARLAARIDTAGHEAAVLVHPASVIGTQVDMQPGSVVCGGVQVSTNVRLGAHVHINPNATIGHDSVLEPFVSINPAAVVSGEVLVERGALIGAGAVILQGLTVGADALVGAAACVTRTVAPATTVKGIPAR